MKRSLLQLAATGCLVSSASLADTVSLANGDRLSGTLVRMEADSLVFVRAGRLRPVRASDSSTSRPSGNGLSLGTQVNVDYDAVPAVGKEATDTDYVL